ncbi:MAG: beta-ketoacyl-ACP synthase III [Zoogloeaceae bacterium]|jgi:3-oxoacyl-[acyl-carrier-protein] synthase-3|nr:beta-ketoacyl-ACP synthase III [Zoogloeaceae bacterium]
MSAVFITATAAFLPNAPVDNAAIENILGKIGGQPSRARAIVLRQNGIQTRHYAIDPTNGQSTHSNAMIAAEAVRILQKSGLALEDIRCLVAGTSLPDQLMPGHAVMLHGELGNPACEVVSTAGVCLAGLAALKYAWLAVKAGDAPNAVAVGSELPSPVLRAGHFAAENIARVEALTAQPQIAFEKDFLRWMLSDGAGAFWLAASPKSGQPNLRIDWIELSSAAHRLPVCMYAGGERDADGRFSGWMRFPATAWAAQSVFAIKQDVKLLEQHVVEATLETPLRDIIARRGLRAEDIDWFLPHMSSYYFRQPIAEGLARAGLPIPFERWFTNLASCGNTGAASLYIMLDELRRSGQIRAGQKLLCFVPESGRFSSGFMALTVCE